MSTNRTQIRKWLELFLFLEINCSVFFNGIYKYNWRWCCRMQNKWNSVIQRGHQLNLIWYVEMSFWLLSVLLLLINIFASNAQFMPIEYNIYEWRSFDSINQKQKTNEMPSRTRNNNIENRFVETHMASSYTHIYCFLFAVSLNTEHLMDFHFNYISLCCCSCYYYWCFWISVCLSWLIVDWNSLAKCISYQNQFYCYYFITYITYKLLPFFSSTISIMYIFVNIFIVFNLLNNEINVQVT